MYGFIHSPRQALNVIIAHKADALVAVTGGASALSKIGHSLKIGKPVIGLKTISSLKGVHYLKAAREAVDRAFEIIGVLYTYMLPLHACDPTRRQLYIRKIPIKPSLFRLLKARENIYGMDSIINKFETDPMIAEEDPIIF